MISGPSKRIACSSIRSMKYLPTRTFASSTICFNISKQQERQASTSSSTSSSAKKAQDAAISQSSCTPGTSLSGLNIYKDRADPVALPDDQYPEWLWKILDDSKKTSSGVVLESTEGMTKGEARAAEKRNLRAIRAAHRAKERTLARQTQMAKEAAAINAGAGMNATGGESQGLENITANLHPESAEGLAVQAANAVLDPKVSFSQAKKHLRKANRANIKASNFVKSQ